MLLSSHGPGRTAEIEVTGPVELQHALGDALSELAKFRNRKALESSELYRRLRASVDDVTFGLEYVAFTGQRPPASEATFRVVSWNIQRGTRLEGVIEVLNGHRELRGADLILLLECDLGMARSGNRNVPRWIAQALGYDYVYGNSYLCLSGGNRREEDQPVSNSLSLSGNAILSRRPLVRAENLSLAVTKDKFLTREKRLGHKKALWVEALVADRSVAIAAVHLDSGASSAQRARQLLDLVNRLERRGVARHALIGGDFNTTTYDAQNPAAVLGSLAGKLWRGGFPHAIEHYLTPQKLYERAVFEVLKSAGYQVEAFNEPNVGTLRYEVGDVGSEGRVRDFLPRPFVELLRRKLAPYGGVVGLKVDWFAGRGVIPLRAGTIARPLHGGVGVSDHDPIWVEVALDG